MDLNAPIGTPVRAVTDGVVVFRAGPDQGAGWGDGLHALFVRHPNGTSPFVALYGHLLAKVDEGSQVSRGQVIGTIGSYEETFDGERQVYEPHLHFGVHPGLTMPTGPSGLAHDPLCQGGDTHGWVAPLAYLGVLTATP